MAAEKINDRVKALAKRKTNSSCFICSQAGANYAISSPTIGVFMCSMCGGLVRAIPDLGMRCKGVSMTNFTSAEADWLEVRRVACRGCPRRTHRGFIAPFPPSRRRSAATSASAQHGGRTLTRPRTPRLSRRSTCCAPSSPRSSRTSGGTRTTPTTAAARHASRWSLTRGAARGRPCRAWGEGARSRRQAPCPQGLAVHARVAAPLPPQTPPPRAARLTLITASAAALLPPLLQQRQRPLPRPQWRQTRGAWTLGAARPLLQQLPRLRPL